MTRRLVDERWVPEAVAGHPALELCNTRGGWRTARPNEYLVDYRALVVWGRENGLLTSAEYRSARAEALTRSRSAGGVLRQVLRLRSALYAALVDDDGAALDEVRRAVAAAVHRSAYRSSDLTVRLDGGSGLTAVLDRCALAAHRLLEQHGPDAVGRCAGVGCGWLFLDPSHRRRWCTMAVCGNRAKARRYAARWADRPLS
ncbi:MAG: CGNR zinc finger domain-containing protein [Actinomycetota bacterium]